MKERPILFSSAMIRALLAGTKTQTRRIVKLPPDSGEVHIDPGGTIFGPGPYLKVEAINGANAGAAIHPRIHCPYGYPGDRLWVRETWFTAAELDKMSPAEIGDYAIVAGYSKPWAPIRYVADGATCNGDTIRDFGGWSARFRPAIHMPRWASRLTLEVTGVRVERLHEITEEDALAEGAAPYIYGHGFISETEIAADPGIRSPSMYRAGFEQLWREINGAESWDANPFVWVVSFKRVHDVEREVRRQLA